MPVPSNTTAETAILIESLPYANSQDVHDSGTTYTVWYKYIVGVGDDPHVIEWFFRGVFGGGGYRPRTTVRLTDDLWFLNQGIQNGHSQLPARPGDVLYFQIVPNSGNPSPAVLTVTVRRGPETPATAGQILIRGASMSSTQLNAGYKGLPGGFINTAGSEIVGFVPELIVGETGDVLPDNGRMLFADEAGSEAGFPANGYYFYLFNPDFTIRSSFEFDTNLLPYVRTHNPSGKFYILSHGLGLTNSTYRTVDADGVLGTLQTLPNIQGTCAVDASETIMYLADRTTIDSRVRRWNLNSLSYESDLVAGVASSKVTDMIVLSDDSIVVAWWNTSTRVLKVRRFDPAGTQLNDYSLSFSGALSIVSPRLGYATGTPEAFWLLVHTNDDGMNEIQKIQASDGAVLVTSITANGDNELIELEDPPLVMTSDSCPILELRMSVEGEGSSGEEIPGTYRTIRRLRQGPHVFDGTTTFVLDRLEFILETPSVDSFGQGSDPKIMISISTDRGRTFGPERFVATGKIGELRKQVLTRRWGRMRSLVGRIVVSDPVPWHIVGALIDITPGSG